MACAEEASILYEPLSHTIDRVHVGKIEAGLRVHGQRRSAEIRPQVRKTAVGRDECLRAGDDPALNGEVLPRLETIDGVNGQCWIWVEALVIAGLVGRLQQDDVGLLRQGTDDFLERRVIVSGVRKGRSEDGLDRCVGLGDVEWLHLILF